jgi:septum formation protein
MIDRHDPSSPRRLVLASSSPYRRALLDRLRLPYEVATPECDEAPKPGETVRGQVLRLACAKAKALSSAYPHALIVGSDQLAEANGRTLGKPGDFESAVDQLCHMAGETVTFHTGLCLLDADRDGTQTEIVPFRVRLRRLSRRAIERYVRVEQPYDCAGSFKSEGLGITLFDWMRGDDPTALIGLPLISLVRMLNRAGISVP